MTFKIITGTSQGNAQLAAQNVWMLSENAVEKLQQSVQNFSACVPFLGF